jgi:hypothetical protein
MTVLFEIDLTSEDANNRRFPDPADGDGGLAAAGRLVIRG